MKRRNFLRTGAIAGTSPFLLNQVPLFALESRSRALYEKMQESQRVLVLIQLRGGNDGLNTLIPLDQYNNLYKARPEVILPEKAILPLSHNNGLHPKMEGIQRLFQDRKVGIVQSVGYPLPNKSHFRSTDIWETASASDEVLQTGWLGRYIDKQHSGFPDNYPNAQYPDPLAITLGSVVSTTCQGPVSNMSMALQNLNQFAQLPLNEESVEGSTLYQRELGFIRQSLKQTNQYFETIQQAADTGKNLSRLYPDRGNSLSNQLRIVARLIHGGLQTPIYIVNLGGFDTHANQVRANDPNTEGNHAELLEQVSTAVSAFQDDLSRMGIEDRVLGMTYSEFGRRIASNASNGTDHGTAAPLFLFGTQVNPRIHGDSPKISASVNVKDNLPMQYDFRSVFGTVLQDWMGIEEEEIKELLFDEYRHLPLIGHDHPDSPGGLPPGSLALYPNPAVDRVTISLDIEGIYPGSIELYDPAGRRIRTMGREYPAGIPQTISMDLEGLSPGNYYVRWISQEVQEVELLRVMPQ